MARSFLKTLLCAAMLSAAACSTGQPPAPYVPPFLGHAATLNFTTGIDAAAVVAMPPGFVPIADRPPMWLKQGAEIGVIGVRNGHRVIYGLSGSGWRTGRVLAAETGPEAATAGTIVDAAASPDGLTLATAVVTPDGDRLEIVLRDLIAIGIGHPVAEFGGRFDSVSLSWLNPATIALALRRHSAPAAPEQFARRNRGAIAPPAPATPAPNGLQIMVVAGAVSAMPLKLGCPMSALSWSRHRRYAVAQGDSGAPPMLIDRKNRTCAPFHVRQPIRVLDWDRANEGSFLYLAPDPAGPTIGLYEYNIASGAEHAMGISTAAAAFTNGGSILAIGDQNLSFKLALRQPNRPLLVQAAVIRPDHSEVDLKSLGFYSTPAMLAHSSMAYSRATDRATIQTFAPSLPVPWRKIVEYSVAAGAAYLLAEGPADGTVTMSWSPKGRWLAILDGGGATGTDLAVLAPPR
ncbi:MAG: hypothetical protein ACREQI_13975 [Candidatus Binataceae bacterium]